MSEHGNAPTDDVAAAKAEYEDVVFQTEWGYTATSKAADKVIAALEALVDAQARQLAAARAVLEEIGECGTSYWGSYNDDAANDTIREIQVLVRDALAQPADAQA